MTKVCNNCGLATSKHIKWNFGKHVLACTRAVEQQLFKAEGDTVEKAIPTSTDFYTSNTCGSTGACGHEILQVRRYVADLRITKVWERRPGQKLMLVMRKRPLLAKLFAVRPPRFL